MKKSILTMEDLLGKKDKLPKYKIDKKKDNIKIKKGLEKKDLYYLF